MVENVTNVSDGITEKDGLVEPELQKSRHSNWRYASLGSFQVIATLVGSTQAIYLYFYYFNVLGLDNDLIFLALTIFTIYDAINDPIIAFLVDRNFKWTRKWGRRFPWIVIGIVPWILSLYLIFSAPDVDASVNPWPVFWWLIGSMVIYDTFMTLVTVNIGALHPDIFREESERQKFTYFWVFFDIAAQGIGMMLPPMLLGSNDRESFAFMAGVIMFICLVMAAFFLPGTREDKVVIDRYYDGNHEKMGMFKGWIEVLKLKSFIAFFVALMCFNMAVSIIMTMGPFISNFLLQLPPGDEIIIYVVFLSGTIISIPFWVKYLKKTQDAKKALSIGGFALAITFIPLTFYVGMVDLLIYFFLCGLAMGSMWAFFYTIIANSVIDDFVATTKKNQKGILLGVWAVMARLVATLDEGIITLVQNITGFPAGVENFEALEAEVIATGGDMGLIQNGLRILIGVIPGLIIFIGTFVFWKLYPLTPDKVKENKEILRKLNL
ncbi:MAG: MFS transporter [Promethearchaeota archaeon]|nr:MAG: MFS transporter [Candidatus Lokiarchaeota archaeon]